jgi:hypothetical protein
MKTTLMFALIICVAGLSACDDEKSGPDYNTLCTTSCGVDETCNLLDSLTLEQCIVECEEEAVNQLDGFFEAFVQCKEEKTCQELSEGGKNSTICYDENVDECVTDTENYLHAACSKKLECEGIEEPTIEEMNECKETMHGDGNVLRCFTESKLQEAEICIEEADTCTPDPIKECVETILSLTLGNNPSNNQTD